jgi:hypothetical protein
MVCKTFCRNHLSPKNKNGGVSCKNKNGGDAGGEAAAFQRRRMAHGPWPTVSHCT